MNNISQFDADLTDQLLNALAEQLAASDASYQLVVIGGSALQALGADRPTGDVDVVALVVDRHLVPAEPMPATLVSARDRVARDFALPARWLNADPAGLLDFGLPEAFMERVVTREYGPSLTVHFASRLDQVHFKLFAAVDQGPGRHEVDLRHLDPTPEELVAAARWSRGHDPSPGFAQSLRAALEALGVSDANLGA